jgi:hypothetical protein
MVNGHKCKPTLTSTVSPPLKPILHFCFGKVRGYPTTLVMFVVAPEGEGENTNY